MKLKIIHIGEFFLLAVIIFNILGLAWQQKDKYFSSNYWERFPSLKNAYYNSIYANKKGSWFPDETIYAFNGGALIRGENPILISPEVPPTGKYLIGFSALVFNNENIICMLSSLVSLIILFLLGKQIFSSTFVALLPPTLLSSEPIFLNQLIYTPLLDIIQLMFLLLSFYSFNKALKSKKHILALFLLTNLFFGLFISTKFFGLGITVVLAFFIVLLLNNNKKRLKLFIITLPFSVFVLLVSYIRVLILGYPINKFLGIQKWVFLYNQGHLHMPFSIWPLLFLNKWYVWWGNDKILSDPQWRITWPIIGALTIAAILLYLLRKIPKKKEVEVLMAWAFFYFLVLSFADTSARYFVILIPVMYLIAVFTVLSLMKLIIKKTK